MSQRSGQKKTLAVWKFASCDGCQLSLLDLEDDLLLISESIEIAYFPEATSRVIAGPYDLSLVEGSVTTPADLKRIREVREQSNFLVTIGACATAGGIQALRNFQDSQEFLRQVYAKPEYIETLATSTPIADYVAVDFELRGCPINKHQLKEVICAYLWGKTPAVRHHSVCIDCKRQGVVCVMVAQNKACLGPLTQAGCGALCPSYNRGCYGCYGPKENPNPTSLGDDLLQRGEQPARLLQLFRNFNGFAEPFRKESQRYES
jgi:coenzyme F420-reducing hydrogenase gamma subunit